MTDEEIEKALQKCYDKFWEVSPSQIFLQDAIDYIKRLKAENEDLYFQNQNLQTYIDNHEEIWKRNAEIDKAIVCKDTAKEILQELFGAREFEPLYDCDTSGYVRLKEIKELSKKYGVEVDDD